MHQRKDEEQGNLLHEFQSDFYNIQGPLRDYDE